MYKQKSLTFSLDVKSGYNYYPFGMLQPGGYYELGTYRYAYNGMEKDDEVKSHTMDLPSQFADGRGNSYTTEYRNYDSRTVRWWSLDPKPSASESEYNGMGDNPINFIDPTGSVVNAVDKKAKTYIQNSVGKDYSKYVTFDKNNNVIFTISGKELEDKTAKNINLKRLVDLSSPDVPIVYVESMTPAYAHKNKQGSLVHNMPDAWDVKTASGSIETEGFTNNPSDADYHGDNKAPKDKKYEPKFLIGIYIPATKDASTFYNISTDGKIHAYINSNPTQLTTGKATAHELYLHAYYQLILKIPKCGDDNNDLQIERPKIEGKAK